jgi:hypothetical protein
MKLVISYPVNCTNPLMLVRVLLGCDVCMYIRTGEEGMGCMLGVLVHIAYCVSGSFGQLTQGLVFCESISVWPRPCFSR